MRETGRRTDKEKKKKKKNVKNLCKEEIDHVNILINKCMGSERGRGTEERDV